MVSLAACRPFTSTNVEKLLQYKIYFIHTEYSLKIHRARLRPFSSVHGTLVTSNLGLDGARTTSVGLQ